MLSMFYGAKYVLQHHVFGHFAMPFPIFGTEYVLSEKGFKKTPCVCATLIP